MRHRDTIVRLRRTRVYDEYSDSYTLSDWSNPDRLTTTAQFAPGTSEELPQVSVEGVDGYGTLYVALGTDICADDRIELRGRLWAVVGHRSDWLGPIGLIDGSTVRIKLLDVTNG